MYVEIQITIRRCGAKLAQQIGTIAATAQALDGRPVADLASDLFYVAKQEAEEQLARDKQEES